MQLTPELKQQLAEQKKQCIFCKLISGEIPNAKKVFEDDKTIALLDIYPAVKGHTLFMLKEHYPMLLYAAKEEAIHKFSLIPSLSQAIKSAIVKTGINVFVALGSAAGQQSYHFMVHLLPREPEDKFFNFLMKKGAKTSSEERKAISDLVCKVMQTFPKEFSNQDGSMVVYEDEKVKCIIPDEGAAKGQIIIHSKTEEKHLEKLSPEDSAHLFEVASTVSRVVFEALRAQGTNILLISGESDDNPAGRLALHILPRWQNDALQGLVWEPKRPNYNLDDVASKIKDQAWKVKFEGNIKKEINPLKVSPARPNAQKEIMSAIAMIQGK